MQMDKVLVLPNGVRTYVDRVPHIDMVYITVAVGVGSRDESKEEEGLAHFVEHMMFDGTTKRSGKEIFKTINAVGGQINAWTTKSQTSYVAKVRTEHFEVGLDILSDMIKNSTFPEDAIDKEVGVIFEEMSMGRTNDRRMASEIQNDYIYGSHPLAHPIIGNEETVSSFTRDQIESFVDRYYVGSNIVVSVSGNINIVEAQSIVEKYFKDIPKGESKNMTAVYDMILDDVTILRYNDTPQAQIGVVFDCFYTALYIREMVMLQLLSLYLTGTMNSPLTRIIREEEALAYSVTSNAVIGYDHSTLTINVGTDVLNSEKVTNIIRDQLTKIVKDGLDPELFDICINMYKSYIMESYETIDNRSAIFANRIMVYGEPYYYEEELELLKEIDIDDVWSYAKEIFVKGNSNTIIYGKITR